MPYFKWHGLDSTGHVHHGVDFARTKPTLEVFLYKRGFTLLACEKKLASIIPVSNQQRALFFQQIGSLLQAGVRVSDALLVAQSSIEHKQFGFVVKDCEQAIQEGISLSEACSFHPDFFTPFACKLLAAGEESGSLGATCLELADYYFSLDSFVKKLKSALTIPLVTLGFFIIVVGLLLVVVIPRFATLLLSLNKPLPFRTQLLISVSQWVQQHVVGLCLGSCCIIFFAARFFVGRFRRDMTIGGWVLYIPVVRWWVIYACQTSFFKTLGALLLGGVDSARALSLASMGIVCRPLQQRYEAVAHDVRCGVSFQQALQLHDFYLPPFCRAVLAVGENTGGLGKMLVLCADHCQEQLYRMLNRFSVFIQPVVLLCLGVLIAFLIFALYEPLFTMSSCIE